MAARKKGKPASAEKSSTGASRVAEGLYVGGWQDATSFVGARFCVLDEPEEGAPADAQIPIYDGARKSALPANLDRIAELARAARAKGQHVLMFCGHGVRRGPLAAAWYLRKVEGGTIEGAYAKIRAVRPQVEAASEWIRHWVDPDTPPSRSSRSAKSSR